MAALAAALAAGAGAAIVLSDLDRYLPLDLRSSPGFLAQWRIRLLAGQPAACYRTLSRSDIPFELAPPRTLRNGCGYDDAVILTAPDLVGTPRMRCAQSAAYATWMRRVVQPAAQASLGAAVIGVRSFGAFNCRDIVGRPGVRSQHATANAIDITGFELSDGRFVSIAGGWGHDAEGRFLKQVRDGACGLFAGVLSPDWNAAHRDHLHLDLGPAEICR